MASHKRLAILILAAMRTLVYPLIMAAFVLLMAINNPQILRPSRTMAISFTSFAILLIVFVRIYGGFKIGQQKSRPIIYQMALASCLTDIITYLQLQIMNVNAANNDHLELFGVDLLLLAFVFFAQLVILVTFTYLGNYIYFSINKPSKCLVVANNDADTSLISSKIRIFDKQFTITECVSSSDTKLYEKIRENQTIILFHLPASVHQELIEFCYKCQKSIYFDLSIADVIAQNAGSFVLDDVMMTAHTRNGLTLTQRFYKRILDCIVAAIGLIITSPIMLIAAIAIRLDDGGPVIFTQQRLTRGDRLFKIYKFRTMRNDDNAREYSVLAHDDRITKAGAFLRKFRIDELPQLINILKGDMSVVGPRPEILANFNKYITELPEYSYRCRVKAGLTGYAQISGKYNTGAREKLMMDIAYIENYSFWLDIKLIIKTLTVFFKRDSTEPYEKDPSRDSEAV